MTAAGLFVILSSLRPDTVYEATVSSSYIYETSLPSPKLIFQTYSGGFPLIFCLSQCSGIIVAYAQTLSLKWKHYCTVCSDIIVPFVQTLLYRLFRHYCPFCSDIIVPFVQTLLSLLFRHYCTVCSDIFVPNVQTLLYRLFRHYCP